MSAASFAQALKLVLVHEGGYVDHREDPGGRTNKGVTQATYDAYRASKGQAARHVRSIANAEVEAIYRDRYWRPIHADEMPAGVAYAVFDFGVNSGPGRAVKDVQRALGAKVDGVVGPDTLALIEAADDEKLIADLCARRLKFLKSLRTWKTFGKGWERRVRGVEAAALAMARQEPAQAVLTSAPPPQGQIKLQAAAKAPEAAQAQLKTAEGQGWAIAGIGVAGEKARGAAEGLQAHIGMDTMLGRLAFVAFTLLTLIGGVLIGYPYLVRIREKGGLGGFIGSVFKP